MKQGVVWGNLARLMIAFIIAVAVILGFYLYQKKTTGIYHSQSEFGGKVGEIAEERVRDYFGIQSENQPSAQLCPSDTREVWSQNDCYKDQDCMKQPIPGCIIATAYCIQTQCVYCCYT